MSQLLDELLDEIMKDEKSIFLENSINNKGNGYYLCELTTGSSKLNLNVPRVRNGDFRPHILTGTLKESQ